MKILKPIIAILFLTLLNLNSLLFAETLNFKAGTYVGEVKKGKAFGLGVFTFSDGSKYDGKFKKNRIHGKGKFIDPDKNVFEGKFRGGKFRNKINKKTRQIFVLDVNKGISSYFEIKGTGKSFNKWFEAEEISTGIFELTAKGKRDMDSANRDGGDGGGGGSGGGSGGGGGC